MRLVIEAYVVWPRDRRKAPSTRRRIETASGLVWPVCAARCRKAPSTKRCIETTSATSPEVDVEGRKVPSTKRCIEAGVVAPMRHRLSLGEDLAPESYACRRDQPGKNQTSSGIRRTVGGVIIQNRPDHRSVLRLRSRCNESAPSHPETSPQLTA